jgi:hypothetical protein
MPERVVRELEYIRVQGVMQLRSGRRDQDPAKDRPPTPLRRLWREGQRCPECNPSPSSTGHGYIYVAQADAVLEDAQWCVGGVVARLTQNTPRSEKVKHLG